MLSDELVSYLNECKKLNLSLDQVVAQLHSSGWGSEEISQAKVWYSGAGDKPATPVKKFSPKKILAIVGFLSGLVILGCGGWAYLVATGKVLVEDVKVKYSAQKLVYSLPFLNKSPEYIISSIALRDKEVLRSGFDASFALTGDNLFAFAGSNSFEAQLKGYIDVTDENNPLFSLTANVTREFELEMRKPDKKLFLKVKKIPSILALALGSSYELITSALDKWIYFDTSTLESAALSRAQSVEVTGELSDEKTKQVYDRIYKNDILPNLTVVESEYNGNSAYQLIFEPSDQVLDKIVDRLMALEKSLPNIPTTDELTNIPKVSSFMKSSKFFIWVDKDYQILEISISGSIDPDSIVDYLNSHGLSSESESSLSNFNYAFVIKVSDLGKKIDIETPTDSIPAEQFYVEMGDVIKSLDPSPQLSQARNAKRRADISQISVAIMAYQAINGDLPSEMPDDLTEISRNGANLCSSLIPTELAVLPVDPSFGSNHVVSDCSSDYHTGYWIVKQSDGFAISAPMAEAGETIYQSF